MHVHSSPMRFRCSIGQLRLPITDEKCFLRNISRKAGVSKTPSADSRLTVFNSSERLIESFFEGVHGTIDVPEFRTKGFDVFGFTRK